MEGRQIKDYYTHTHSIPANFVSVVWQPAQLKRKQVQHVFTEQTITQYYLAHNLQDYGASVISRKPQLPRTTQGFSLHLITLFPHTGSATHWGSSCLAASAHSSALSGQPTQCMYVHTFTGIVCPLPFPKQDYREGEDILWGLAAALAAMHMRMHVHACACTCMYAHVCVVGQSQPIV